MVRHPHTLVLSWKEEGTFSGGDYSPGTAASQTIEGRAEANGKGNLIRTEDGAQIVYDWTFHCRPADFDAPFGADAELKQGSATFWKGKLKRQANAQKHTRIWL